MKPESFSFRLYNSLTRQEEVFQPVNPPFVGMYVCGPTVYGHAHLGHARPYINADILFRFLKAQGYAVRYVRNITDVGHLLNDADDGEDKIAIKARLESLEPMEVAQFYSDSFFEDLAQLNILRPSIEPRATGHIPEQIQMIQEIMNAGLAYEVNGSVYFDVHAYNQHHHYGILSGRSLEDMLSGMGSRTLDGQDEKRNAQDFALWKKANPEHIMRWSSPWGVGFPGWHIECSAMSNKYLGKTFDIHGGGMDLQFPHHEAEIAQSVTCFHKVPSRFWIHNNMLTVNGQKMAKSLNNGIGLKELFEGNHHLLERAYTPMNLRFFLLQAHYRSTVDFSNEALQAADKGYKRLSEAYMRLKNLTSTLENSDRNWQEWNVQCWNLIGEDLNTPMLLASLFDAARSINSIADKKEKISESDLFFLQQQFQFWFENVLGLKIEDNNTHQVLGDVMNVLIDLRIQAKSDKNFALSDFIRWQLEEKGIRLKDGKEGTTWSIE